MFSRHRAPILETVLLSMDAGFPDVADTLNGDVIVMGPCGVSHNNLVLL